MTLFARPGMAVAFGAFFICAATCTHFDEITTSPRSLAPDWAAGVFLFGGAILSSRDWPDGRVYQVAAWAFMVSLLFNSVHGNLESWLASETAAAPTGLVTLPLGLHLAIEAVLLAVACGGPIASLRVKRA